MQLGNFIDGLNIIRKYEADDAYSIRAEHDQFWVSGADLALSAEDKAEIERLGWWIDPDADGWSAWV